MHQFTLQAEFVGKESSSFILMEKSLWQKLFNKKLSEDKLQIKTNDVQLRNWLKANKDIAAIFQTLAEDAEFSPSINGNKKEKEFIISISFQLKNPNLFSLSPWLSFFDAFQSYKEKASIK